MGPGDAVFHDVLPSKMVYSMKSQLLADIRECITYTPKKNICRDLLQVLTSQSLSTNTQQKVSKHKIIVAVIICLAKHILLASEISVPPISAPSF